LALVVVAVGAQTPAQNPANAPAMPPAATPMTKAETVANGSPMDRPLRLINEARARFRTVRDYTCYLVAQERIGGQLQAEHLAEMKMRVQPFSVYFRWVAPRQFVGQEVCYVQGKNNNQMRVKSKGLLRVIGFVSIDPNDPRVRQNSRHIITEAGLANLINRLAAAWAKERELNQSRVQIAEYEYNRRRCIRVETIHPSPANGQFQNYRTVVYFDKELHLPIRVELYDWPRRGGNPAGDLNESYSYLNLRFNVRLTDADFNY
jgi:hypothetical protein